MTHLQTIPLFPLPMVLLPTEQIPLHIFEPRYKEMIQYCLATQSVFGMVLMMEKGIAQTGCGAEIIRDLRSYDDGKRDILVEGKETFRIEQIRRDNTYYTADVVWHPIDLNPAPNTLKMRFLALYAKWMEVLNQKSHLQLNAEDHQLSFAVARTLPLKLEQKQILLQIGSETERLGYLSGYLTKSLPDAHEMAETKRLIQSDGHFEDILPDLDLNQDDQD
ncbi:MAG: LON peptidase substrate-binding domain-containing protein [Rhodothermia bacterium]|nr:LON peptidase substrate-binding domain-containing protein [Rhodothermia bacterium]